LGPRSDITSADIVRPATRDDPRGDVRVRHAPYPGHKSVSVDILQVLTEDHRRHAPATARNREAILAVLQRHLPSKGNVLEIASGTGEHILYFAQASSPDLVFQRTDPDAEARASIDAWVASCGVSNVHRAIELDATGEVWPVTSADAALCINMVHIAPWAATEGLARGAARILPTGGMLYLCGPYRFGGRHTASSNEAFDADLRRQNPEWGIRDIEAVVALATAHGFQSPMIEEMPANNVSLVFRRLPR
jgi:hypothetical protein